MRIPKEELSKRAWTIKEELKGIETGTVAGRGYRYEGEEETKALEVEAMISKWSEFEQQMEVIRDVFMHMERKKRRDDDAENSNSFAGRGAGDDADAKKRECKEEESWAYD